MRRKLGSGLDPQPQPQPQPQPHLSLSLSLTLSLSLSLTLSLSLSLTRCGGVMMCTAAELNFHPVGFGAVIAATLLRGVKSIVQQR